MEPLNNDNYFMKIQWNDWYMHLTIWPGLIFKKSVVICLLFDLLMKIICL